MGYLLYYKNIELEWKRDAKKEMLFWRNFRHVKVDSPQSQQSTYSLIRSFDIFFVGYPNKLLSKKKQ